MAPYFTKVLFLLNREVLVTGSYIDFVMGTLQVDDDGLFVETSNAKVSFCFQDVSKVEDTTITLKTRNGSVTANNGSVAVGGSIKGNITTGNKKYEW